MDCRRHCDVLLLPSPEVYMYKWLKRTVLVVAAAFVVFYLFTRPEDSAELVKTVIGWFGAVIKFFETLVK